VLNPWLAGETAFINEALAAQLAARVGDEIVLRVRKPTALAQDAVITPRDETGVALRLKVGHVLSPDLLGDFSLTPNQIPPANLFLPHDLLADKVGLNDKANLAVHGSLSVKTGDFLRVEHAWWRQARLHLAEWLRPRNGIARWRGRLARLVEPKEIVPQAPPEAPASLALAWLNAELSRVFTIGDAELSLQIITPPASATGSEYVKPTIELNSNRIFLDSPVIQAASVPRTRLLEGHLSVPVDTALDLASAQAVTNKFSLLTYLVNLIRAGDRETPYSMVAALDHKLLPPDMRDDEILVNEWLADDLRVNPGDSVRLIYYLPESGSRLTQRTNSFRVRAVIPMKGIFADRTLMPDFPGLAKAESTRDWNAAFPLEHRIRQIDEDYWKKYRGTPKAFITLSAGQNMWANRFGSLTAIRYPIPPGPHPAVWREVLCRNLLANLDPASLSLRWEPVREQALAAANQSQDFAGLFLGFSFFLIAAALLLVALLFRFGIEQRAEELGTLLALGLRPAQVRHLLLGEGCAIASIGALIGLFAGSGYARALLKGLSTIWKDAVGSAPLDFHAGPNTMLIGTIASVCVALLAIWLTLRQQAHRPARELLAEGTALSSPTFPRPGPVVRRTLYLPAGAALGALLLIAWALVQRDPPTESFFGAGALLLLAGLGSCSTLLLLLARSNQATRVSILSMGVRSLARRPKRSLTTVGLIACGSFLIVAVGANRLDAGRDAARRTSGTGGFALLAESALPVNYDLNSTAGRNFFGLDEKLLDGVQIVQLRVHDGDDASCLNLNRAQRPRLLGLNPEALASRNAFAFAKVARQSPPANGWAMLASQSTALSHPPSVPIPSRQPPVTYPLEVPAIGDAASIRWALGKHVGDTLSYVDERSHTFKLRIVGALRNSILQGNLLISEDAFVSLFPSESGYRMFLIDAPANRLAEVSAHLSRALGDLGLEITPAVRRLADFNAVQNTYLSTFQALGGLGLLLGSAGLGVVVLRNVMERRGELALLLAVGFRQQHLKRLVLSEHTALLVLGLTLGAVAAVVAVFPAWLSQGEEFPILSMGLTLLAVFINGLVWTWLATAAALRGRLLDALRNE
jgi:ABC-type antimicrobial peptide transport system permease subunit